MTDRANYLACDTVIFGPFQLIATGRLLIKDKQPVALGGRALDILIPPIERAGEVVTRRELLDRVSPNVFVEEANLRVHIGFLRKALADEICRWLDGIPFAIELVAGRAGAYGIRGIVNLLNEQMDLIWQGRRSALPRQQTLQAMLDWSYDLLSECEQTILRRLSVFADVFALDAAQWWRCYSGGRRTLRAQAEHLRDRKGYVVHCSKLTWT